MPGLLGSLLDASDFPARWHCGRWTPALGWSSMAADAATLAVFWATAAVLLAVYWRRRADFGPLGCRAVLWFAAVFLLCGLVHLSGILAFRWPAYRLFVLLKVALAVVATRAALMLPCVAREAVKLPTRAERHDLRDKLAAKNAMLQDALDQQLQITARLEARIRVLQWRRESGGRYQSIDAEIEELRRLLSEVRPP